MVYFFKILTNLHRFYSIRWFWLLKNWRIFELFFHQTRFKMSCHVTSLIVRPLAFYKDFEKTSIVLKRLNLVYNETPDVLCRKYPCKDKKTARPCSMRKPSGHLLWKDCWSSWGEFLLYKRKTFWYSKKKLSREEYMLCSRRIFCVLRGDFLAS